MATAEKMTFFQFLRQQAAVNESGIFFGNLVASLFIDFLLEDTDRCDVKLYTDIFFTIGMSHYFVLLTNAMLAYAERVGVPARFLTGLNWFVRLARWLVMLVQYTTYLLLGGYVFYVIYLRSLGQLTVYEDDECRRRAGGLHFLENNATDALPQAQSIETWHTGSFFH